MKLSIILLIMLWLVMSMTGYTLWKNQVPLREPPGFLSRLLIYLSQNTAVTDKQPRLPELKTPVINRPAKTVTQRLHQIIPMLGWQLQSTDSTHDGTETLHAVVTTRWMRFKDDVMITIIPISPDQSELHIRSESRIGQADFGANSGHILKLLGALSKKSDL